MAGEGSRRAGGARLRVLSYNVHGQRDDPAALRSVVRAVAPDVLIVQEAPRRLRWRRRCAALAEAFGLVVAAGGLPALGNLVLTSLRVRVQAAWCLRYPLTPGRHMRGAAFAECSLVVAADDTCAPDAAQAPAACANGDASAACANGDASVPATSMARFAVAGSHLSTDAVERPGQAALLKREMSCVRAPLILGVDLNESPGGAAWNTLAAGMVDAASAVDRAGDPTYSCANPRTRIDAVFVDPRIAVLDYDVVDTPLARRASDHFPVLADLLVPVTRPRAVRVRR